jgi:hypothetical protein
VSFAAPAANDILKKLHFQTFSLTFEIIFSSNFLITCTKKLFEATEKRFSFGTKLKYQLLNKSSQNLKNILRFCSTLISQSTKIS